jgi:hypothetical protein
MRKYALALLVALSAIGAVRTALARLQYAKAFDEAYLADNENKEYVEMVRKGQNKCMVCHQGKNRKHRNPYGAHIGELLEKKNVKDAEKIKEVLAKAGELHSDAEDDKSPTYDELIKKGELPGGPLEEVMKEPETK